MRKSIFNLIYCKIKSFYLTAKLITRVMFFCAGIRLMFLIRSFIFIKNNTKIYNYLSSKALYLEKNMIDVIINTAKINIKINNLNKINQIITQNILNKPIIILSNHQSFFDIPILFRIINIYNAKYNTPKNLSDLLIRMLAKKELIKVPLFGKNMVQLGHPTIDRKNTTKAKKDLEAAKQKLNPNVMLWAAPEGTRAINNKLLPFKKGVFIMAIELDALIIPVSIKDSYKIVKKKSIFNIKTNQEVTITIHPAIDTVNYNLNNKDELINLTRNIISQNI